MSHKNDSPDALGVLHQKQIEDVDLVRDIWKGTGHVRTLSTKYLPKFPKETDGGYTARVATSVLFNAFKRTVAGLTGLVMRKDPKLGDDVPEDIVTAWENIDLAGRHGDVFTKDVLENAMVDGHSHIFVDLQEAVKLVNLETGEAQTPTLEDEQDLRPYWINVKKQDVLRFGQITIKGRVVLVSLAFREFVLRPVGNFSEEKVERIRDYQLVRDESGQRHVVFRLFERDKSKDASGQWVLISEGLMTINEIPLVTVYTNRKAFMVSEPPLLDLAYENIAHYQLRSDRMNTLHIAGTPVPVFSGMNEDGPIGMGADLGLSLPPGATADYLEPTGASLKETRQELQDIEARMAVLGMSMLKAETRSAETAEAKRLDRGEKDSALSMSARNLQDGTEEALRLHAKWLVPASETGGSMAINKDFQDLKLLPAKIKVYSEAVIAKQISIETFWQILFEGEELPEGFDPEEEKKRLGITDEPEPEPEPVEPIPVVVMPVPPETPPPEPEPEPEEDE